LFPKVLEKVEGAEDIFKQGGMTGAIPALQVPLSQRPPTQPICTLLLATTSFRQLYELEPYKNFNFLYTVNAEWLSVSLFLRSCLSFLLTADDTAKLLDLGYAHGVAQ
jgi:hypothetical protein